MSQSALVDLEPLEIPILVVTLLAFLPYLVPTSPRGEFDPLESQTESLTRWRVKLASRAFWYKITDTSNGLRAFLWRNELDRHHYHCNKTSHEYNISVPACHHLKEDIMRHLFMCWLLLKLLARHRNFPF